MNPDHTNSNQTNAAPRDTRRRWPEWLRVALIGRRPRVTLLRAAVLAGVAFVVFGFILLPVRIEGPSMLPAFRPGSFHLVNRLAYWWGTPQRGDVVAIRISGREYNGRELLGDLVRLRVNFRRLFRPSVMYLKRVVGLPGETIEFVDGRLLVNGRPLDEPWRRAPCNWTLPPRTLGPDQFFVVGDNRAQRPEDHTFGAAERARIVGKVIL
ncbi:MAG: signal peptidase I [Verrucomicrobiae bacterium]|nr:signal peptidase I [Verrucomicrobiae bacterium]MDW8308752.1 signal peptidase I [Verrucomicrobiales bacterium]